MARAGLGRRGGRCSPTTSTPARAPSYAANWGAEALRVADVASLAARDLPGAADLAWASFPCQDLSLAGAGAGLDGARSGAFWGFLSVMEALKAEAARRA